MMTLNNVCDLLKENDCFYILTHQSPDGDTLGSAFALCLALQKLNKKAKVLCSDEIPYKYNYMYKNVIAQEFESKYIVSVDIADTKLLGDNLSSYSNKIDLCIDHHGSNTGYTKNLFVDPTSAATAEIIYKTICSLNVPIDTSIANCLYTGICTDTGSFKYSNVTAVTHRIAADLIENGAESAFISRIMFDTKSRAYIEIERLVLENLDFFFNGKCAMAYITNDMIERSNAKEGDTDGISSIPRKIEGVIVGVTIREKECDTYKISVRTSSKINASEICKAFGGGGHNAAAGCLIKGTLNHVKDELLRVISSKLEGTI